MYKITGLHSENIKRIKLVNIVCDEQGKLIIVSGANAQGKSSLLDSIWMAFGGKSAVPDKPIRDGETSAEVQVQIKSGEKSFTIKRRFTEKNPSGDLTVTQSDGSDFTNPQEMLNYIVGNLSFDPLAFTRLSNKEQIAQLMAITGLDFSGIEQEIKELRENRTLVGRVQKTYTPIPEEELENITSLADRPEVSVSELSTKYQQASEQQQKYSRACERIGEIDKQIEVLQQEKAVLVNIKPTTENPAVLKADLETADSKNKAIREAKLRLESHNHFLEKKREYDEMTESIKEKEDSKKEQLSTATLPVDGLSWNEDGVNFNGMPFDQLSSSEQLKISMAIAMAANPKLRVIMIKDGSLLDKQSLEVIGNLCEEKDYQVWMEYVDESGDVGIVIEDGEVKKVNS